MASFQGVVVLTRDNDTARGLDPPARKVFSCRHCGGILTRPTMPSSPKV